MVIINNFEEYKSLEGVMVGISPWHLIDQDQINLFADATLIISGFILIIGKRLTKDHITQQLHMVI